MNAATPEQRRSFSSAWWQCLRALGLAGLCWAAGLLWAQESLNQGPVLDIEVSRGDQTLPSYQVNRLKAGDVLTIRAAALPEVRQILLVSLIQPTGQQVKNTSFEINKDPVTARVVVQSDDQVPVIILAPLLRNMFGLYASFSESENFLQDVIRSDPQRFVALQTTDLINRAIATITLWLDAQVRGRKSDEAAALARSMAEKFGVRDISPDCFKGGVIRTQCVAIEMVTSKDFFMPSSGVLDEVSGQGRSQDLSGFLVSNLKVISQARDYLSNRYRDQYEFAPSFARPMSDGSTSVQLLSPVRNRMGSTKTAYVYVPGWFTGPVPQIIANDGYAGCLLAGRARVMLEGRLPLAPYWHAFQITLSDPGTGEVLGHIEQVGFNPTRDEIVFQPPRLGADKWPASQQVLVQLSGLFGFDPIKSTSFLMDLPVRQLRPENIQGLSGLVAGHQVELTIQSPARSACLLSTQLTLPDQRQVQSVPQQPERFDVDLSDVPSGNARMTLFQVGLGEVSLGMPIQAAVPTFELAPGPNPLLVYPSEKARQWSLRLDDELMSDDSAFSLRLRAIAPLRLNQSAYLLQWRVVAANGSINPPQSVPLMADQGLQELRTRSPVQLSGVNWPGLLNPIEYRVLGPKGKPLSPWQALRKSVLTLPGFKRWQCAPAAGQWWMSGDRLELIRGIGWVDAHSDKTTDQSANPLPPARFEACPDGLCLVLPQPQPGQSLAMDLHWLEPRTFVLNRVEAPQCPAPDPAQ